LKKKIQ